MNLGPDFFARPTPSVANLDARESVRVRAWREKMRTMAIQDPPAAVDPSALESLQARLAAHPFGIGCVVGVASSAAVLGVIRLGLWFVKLPDGAQRQATVALVLFPLAIALSVWAWRRLS